ncbi:hypothetical protein [Tranquillimonas rosea]|uniref:hypothetical protein n=1 Tax=Tranquillimonas rosea TaxID=641238 RepID=UPI003BADA91D
MADVRIRPIRATAENAVIVLTDRHDARVLIDMPNAEGATVYAAGLDNEFKTARRPGE